MPAGSTGGVACGSPLRWRRDAAVSAPNEISLMNSCRIKTNGIGPQLALNAADPYERKLRSL
jgi:hypothetical protein